MLTDFILEITGPVREGFEELIFFALKGDKLM